MHTWKSPRSFAISSYEGSACDLVTNDLLEVSPLAQRGIASIRPITGRRSLFPASFAHHVVSAPCGMPSSDEGRDGFTVFHSSNFG
jgi:hypothetical protein